MKSITNIEKPGMITKIQHIAHYLSHPSDAAVGIVTGLSSGGIYLYINDILLQVVMMGMYELSLVLFKAGLVAMVSGFCGLLGKEVFTAIRKAIAKKAISEYIAKVKTKLKDS